MLRSMRPEREYPRVVVVSGTAFGEHSATAVTLTNLFHGWPPDRLALVHGDTAATNHRQRFCERIWQISLADVPIDRTVRKLLGKRKDQLVGRASAGMPAGLGARGAGEAAPLRTRLHGVASAWADLLPTRPPQAFWAWANEFQPQLIYSTLGSTRLMGLVLGAAKRCRARIVPHFMDDWPGTYYRGWLNTVPRMIMLSRLRSVMRMSPLGLSICSAMAAEYEQRYGIRFQAFMNCVSVSSECPAMPAGDSGRPLRLLFTGGLHLNRWRSLADVGRALLALREEGIMAELVIHTSMTEAAMFTPTLSAIATIRLGGPLPIDQLRSALQQADILVHVDSFDPTPRQYLRLSMSTKLPLCMASGKAILAYGPRELASCRYVQDSQCGVVVGEQNAALLLKAVRTLASDPQRRAELGRRGWEVARRNHHASVVRERFRLVLARAASSHRGTASVHRCDCAYGRSRL